jgi:hypothetical protein
VSGQVIHQRDSLGATIRDIQTRLRKLEANSGVAGTVTIPNPGGSTLPPLVQLGRLTTGGLGLAIADNAGDIRMIAGEDAAIPGGYGVRVNNAAGTDIWDTMGLVGVASVLSVAALPLTGGTANSSWATIGGSTLNFTVGGTRTQNVMVLSSVCMTTNNSSGASWLYARLAASTGTSSIGTVIPPTGTTSTGLGNFTAFVFLGGIAPGTYSSYWQVETNAGTASYGAVGSSETIVLQLGT